MSLPPPVLLLACFNAIWLAGCGEAVTTEVTVAPPPPPEFVGSAECRECHAPIYRDWQTTWHSFSVRKAAEAQQAAYPLPAGMDWEDVSIVFGGRHRIAYLNNHGDLAQPGFDVRRQQWDSQFPDGNVTSCAPCHFTGPPSTQDQTAGASGWTEETIGCEACHGPGSRHLETFAAEDITVDVSSAGCGTCHTTEGRVLPTPDSHDTHDLVQIWHRDAHATGLGQHSMSAHCATCHDPGNGTHGPYDNPARLVFREHKSDISCTSCHNPHRSTNPVYQRDRAPAAVPQMSALNIHSGRDGDFTTSDYETLADSESGCRSCHRGADRIELDHGDASCVDCHNRFHRSRGRNAPVLHDANQRGLSCRGCHDDADHLISVLFQDPDFLEPRLIHDLGTLSASVVERHGLTRTPATRFAGSIPTPSARERERVAIAELPDPADTPPFPDPVAGHLDAAVAALAESDSARLNAALTALCNLDSSSALPGLGVVPYHSVKQLAELRASAERLAATDPDLPPGLRSCLQALAAILADRPADVLRAVGDIPANERGDLVDALGALAHIERRDARAAMRALQAKLDSEEPRTLLRSVAALAQARRNRPTDSRAQIEQALDAEPDNPVTWFVAGQLASESSEFAEAARAYAEAARRQPGWIDATLSLGRALAFNQQPEESLAVLEQAARSWPGEFNARYRLGSLFKLLSDQLRHQVQRASENRRPAGLSLRDWQFVLNTYAARVQKIAELAYGEYAYALALRPGDQRTVWQTAEALRVMRRYGEARELFASLGKRDPSEWLYPYRGATVAIADDRLSEAVDLLRVAHARKPDQADVLAVLGFALLKSNQPAEAGRQLVKAGAHEPFNPAVFNNLGVARARMGDLAGAERALRRGLELRTFPLPRTHLLHTNLAIVLVRSGRPAEALASAKRAAYVYPGFTAAARLLGELESGAPVSPDYQLNDQMELFGELSTVSSLDLTL